MNNNMIFFRVERNKSTIDVILSPLFNHSFVLLYYSPIVNDKNQWTKSSTCDAILCYKFVIMKINIIVYPGQ